MREKEQALCNCNVPLPASTFNKKFHGPRKHWEKQNTRRADVPLGDEKKHDLKMISNSKIDSRSCYYYFIRNVSKCEMKLLNSYNYQTSFLIHECCSGTSAKHQYNEMNEYGKFEFISLNWVWVSDVISKETGARHKWFKHFRQRAVKINHRILLEIVLKEN